MFYRKVISSTNVVFSGIVRVCGVRLVAGSDAATATLFDSLTQEAGKDFCLLKAGAEGTNNQRFGEGLVMEKGVSVTLTGTNSILYIYYQ